MKTGCDLYDAHVHLDFMTNGEEVAAEAAADGCRLFSVTVTPEGFLTARERFSAFDNVDVGLGLHPWWIKRSDDASLLVGLLDETKFVGEIGLDFGKRHDSTHDEQLEAFSTIVRACAEQGGKTISIHSVHAAREVLDLLESAGTLGTCTCIFHWYSGPSDQLKRAIDAGCWFSVNERMLATKRGREYVKAIPRKRLLFETDAPPEQGMPYSYAELRAELERVEAQIRAIRGE